MLPVADTVVKVAARGVVLPITMLSMVPVPEGFTVMTPPKLVVSVMLLATGLMTTGLAPFMFRPDRLPRLVMPVCAPLVSVPPRLPV